MSKEADLSSFPDSANVQPYARQAMAWPEQESVPWQSDERKPYPALQFELAIGDHIPCMLPEQFDSRPK